MDSISEIRDSFIKELDAVSDIAAIEKIRVGNVGHVRSDETRARMSAHKKTDDHKSKLRNASLMWWAAKKAAETQK